MSASSDWAIQLFLCDHREDQPLDRIEFEEDYLESLTSSGRAFHGARTWLTSVFPAPHACDQISVLLHVTYRATGYTNQRQIIKTDGKFRVLDNGKLLTLEGGVKLLKEELLCQERLTDLKNLAKTSDAG